MSVAGLYEDRRESLFCSGVQERDFGGQIQKDDKAPYAKRVA